MDEENVELLGPHVVAVVGVSDFWEWEVPPVEGRKQRRRW